MSEDKNALLKMVLCVVGGIAGIMAVFVFRRNLGAEYFMFRAMGLFSSGPAEVPGTPEQWFALFHDRLTTALVLSNFFDAVNSVLVFLIMLPLFFILRKTGKGPAILFLSLSAISVVLYSLTNISFPLLILSDRYFSGVSPEVQRQLVSAGQSLLSLNNPALPGPGTGPNLALFFLFASGVTASVLMLRSDTFKRWVGTVGLLANGLGLCFFPVLWSAPSMSYLPMTLSAPFIILWYMVIAVRLIRANI